MKIVEKVENESTGKNVRVVTGEATALLKTMLLVDRNFSADYLVSITRGQSKFPFLEESHSQIETFGALSGSSFYELRNLIHCLYDFGFVDAANPSASCVQITEKGKAFLDEGRHLEVPEFRLRLNKFAFMMETDLRTLCKQLAIENDTETWKILSDFAIGRIIRKQPLTIPELKLLPGITLYKAENYGPQILEVVSAIKQQRAEIYRKRLKRKVSSNTFQEAKKLFESGRTVHQIAQLKDIKESTVRDYLMDLHMAGEIDLRPWIEEQLDAKTLFKGADYFKNVQTPRFREAYEILGLEYDTLRLCRLYVSDYSRAQVQVEID
jgi:hypothetical protein